jgi:hypothetical protein
MTIWTAFRTPKWSYLAVRAARFNVIAGFDAAKARQLVGLGRRRGQSDVLDVDRT